MEATLVKVHWLKLINLFKIKFMKLTNNLLIVLLLFCSIKSYSQNQGYSDLQIIQVSPPPQVVQAHQEWSSNDLFGQWVNQNLTFLGTYWKMGSPFWDGNFYAVYLGPHNYLSFAIISPNGKSVDFMFMAIGANYLELVLNK